MYIQHKRYLLNAYISVILDKNSRVYQKKNIIKLGEIIIYDSIKTEVAFIESIVHFNGQKLYSKND